MTSAMLSVIHPWTATPAHTVPGALDGFAESRSPFPSALPSMREMRAIAHRVRDAPSVEAGLSIVPRELAGLGCFARVIVSTVGDGFWVPRWEHSAAGGMLESALAGLRVPLSGGTVEADVVRSRRTGIARAAARERRTAVVADRIGMNSCAVAPIVAGDETIALIHADHGKGRHPVSEADWELVRLVADFVGVAVETLDVSASIAAERERAWSVLAEAGAAISDSRPPQPIALLDDRGSRAAAPPHGSWSDLSVREELVLGLIVDGLTNRAIAGRLFVSESTVKSHIKHIFRKLGVSTRSEAIARTVRRAARSETAAS